MTTIEGLITDSEGNALTGELVIQLDSPVVETATSPYTLYTTQPSTYEVTAGVVNVDLPETETDNITYRFQFNVLETETLFYFSDGTLYDGPRHQDGGDWFTGVTHSDGEVQVYPAESERSISVLDFHALIPNQSTVDFSDLLPTGITQNILDTSIRRLVQLITTVPAYIAALRGSPSWQGPYNAATYYELGDAVSYGGSSWYYINTTPSAGNTPAEGVYWTAIALKGDPGGTGGNDTPYDATGWNNDANAPSKNAVRDLVEGTLVKTSALASYAPLASPTFTGTPAAPTATAGTATTQIATTAFVNTSFAKLASPTFTGVPAAPTPSVGDNSTKLATTAFVQTAYANSARLLAVAELGGSSFTLTTGTTRVQTQLSFTSEIYDPDNNYNSVTSTFTVPTTGLYRIEANVMLTQDGTNLSFGVNVRVGGVATAVLFRDFGSGFLGTFANSGAVILSLTAGNTITLEADHVRTGGTNTSQLAGVVFGNQFRVYRLT